MARHRKLTKRQRVWRAIVALVIAIGTALSLMGCGESGRDAAPGPRDESPAFGIINMPDGYSNVAAKCHGPNMIYVIYHGSGADSQPYGALSVVANDPRCVKAPS